MLLSFAKGNAKIEKSDKSGEYSTAIMYLAPHSMSGTNICPHASPGCITSCLFLSGHGVYSNVIAARLKRTQFYLKEREKFLTQLKLEIRQHVKRSKGKGLIPCIRLNGTSDIRWEKVCPSLFTEFHDVQFYDYTKNDKRMIEWCEGKLPSNYHLTFSRSEVNDDACRRVIAAGGSVAVVFKRGRVRRGWYGVAVKNGDETDLRFLDPRGKVIGLYAKGKARRDMSGFVVL